MNEETFVPNHEDNRLLEAVFAPGNLVWGADTDFETFDQIVKNGLQPAMYHGQGHLMTERPEAVCFSLLPKGEPPLNYQHSCSFAPNSSQPNEWEYPSDRDMNFAIVVSNKRMLASSLAPYIKAVGKHITGDVPYMDILYEFDESKKHVFGILIDKNYRHWEEPFSNEVIVEYPRGDEQFPGVTTDLWSGIVVKSYKVETRLKR